jgi:hypothetical protein
MCPQPGDMCSLRLRVTPFRERAHRAEAWLLRIRTEVERTFLQNKDRDEPQQTDQ